MRGDSGAELRQAVPGGVIALERVERNASIDGAGQRVEVGAHGLIRVVKRAGGHDRPEEAHGACFELSPPGRGQDARTTERLHHALTPGPEERAALVWGGETAPVAQVRRGGRGVWARGRRHAASRFRACEARCFLGSRKSSALPRRQKGICGALSV